MHAQPALFPADRAVVLNAPIATARLQLEPLVAAHADELYTLLQDDAIYRWISSTKPNSVAELRTRWERNATRVSPDGREAWLAWAVRRTSDGVVIGKLDANIQPDFVASNVGYVFGAPFWGKGLASEAVTALTQHLMGQGVTRLVATVTVGNAASGRVLVKAGFTNARVLSDNDTIRGVLCDDQEYVANAPLCPQST